MYQGKKLIEKMKEKGYKERKEIEKKFGVSYEMAKDIIKYELAKDLSLDEYVVILLYLKNYDEMYFNPDEETKEFYIGRAYTEIYGMEAFEDIDPKDLLF